MLLLILPFVAALRTLVLLPVPPIPPPRRFLFLLVVVFVLPPLCFCDEDAVEMEGGGSCCFFTLVALPGWREDGGGGEALVVVADVSPLLPDNLAINFVVGGGLLLVLAFLALAAIFSASRRPYQRAGSDMVSSTMVVEAPPPCLHVSEAVSIFW